MSHRQARIAVHGFTISSVPIILPVFRKLLLRNENFRVIIFFETSDHNLQTAYYNSKVTSQATSTSNNFSSIYFQIGIIFQLKFYMHICIDVYITKSSII